MAPDQQDQGRVSVGAAGLVLSRGAEAETLPFLSGALHYYQLPRRAWSACLDALQGLGLSIVESYVPWAVHERGRGHFEFDSDGSGRHCANLQAFVELCDARGLKLILRPGPHVNAELTGFGFPWRILEEPRCLARGARGNLVIMPTPPRCFPVPSYASERFLEEAETWLSAFAEIAAPLQWPAGPLIGAQVDNELSLFFRTAAYDQDYHPDALTRFREYVARCHGERLPPGYLAAADAVEPPRQFDAHTPDQLVPHLDWVAFKEQLVASALERMANALRAGGLDRVPLMHNFPATPGGDVCSISSAEQQLDLVGLDLYPARRDYSAVRRAARMLSGSSRLPLLIELGWGAWPWWFPQNLEDQLSNALAALMHGIKGFNLYMAVGRDRWYGAPIDAEGCPRDDSYQVTRSLLAAVKDSRLPALHNTARVAMMRVRDYQRLELCTSLVDPLPPMALALLGVGAAELSSDDPLGFEGAIQREVTPYERLVEELLEELGIPFELLDCTCSTEQLSRYALLVVPTFDFIDSQIVGRLTTFVEGGGTLLCGPRRPQLDRTMQALERELPRHTLAAVDTLQDTLEDLLAQIGVTRQMHCDNERVELVRYDDDEGGAVLFAANRSDTSCASAIHGLGAAELRIWDGLTGTPVDPSCLHLEARQVRMLRVGPAGAASDDLERGAS